MKSRTALVLLFALASGCAAYRPPTRLDANDRAEVALLGASLRDQGIRIVVTTTKTDPAAMDVVEALDAVGVATFDRVAEPNAADLNVSVEGMSREAFGWDVYLILPTLGLYPAATDGRETYRLRLTTASGRDETSTCGTERPMVFGWFGIPASLRAGWRLATPGVPAGRESERTARIERLGVSLLRTVLQFANVQQKGSP